VLLWTRQRQVSVPWWAVDGDRWYRARVRAVRTCVCSLFVTQTGGASPLFAASSKGRGEAVALLLTAGASANKATVSSATLFESPQPNPMTPDLSRFCMFVDAPGL
jgi:hypothetical protein